MRQEIISADNSKFWDELCGSYAAKELGITDSSKESLKKFDDWYFESYPYLSCHIPFSELAGKDVLEVGLGYGTVSQKIAESGANYTGLDIAVNPVEMVSHRLKQAGMGGKAEQGSILIPPFADESFDAIVSIGCLHHTGNLRLAIEQCWKLLRPGGLLIFMVYYSYSYRRFRMAPTATMRYFVREMQGYRGVVGGSSDNERKAYDAGATGEGAPHTDWISVRSLRELCADFSFFSAKTENIDVHPLPNRVRVALLNTWLPAIAGLDVYATGKK